MTEEVTNPLYLEDDEKSHITLRSLVDRGIMRPHVTTFRGNVRPEWMLVMEDEYRDQTRWYLPIHKDTYDQLMQERIDKA